MNEITVYSKPSCVQCNATYRTLGDADYSTVDISQDAGALEKIRSHGFQQAPVVFVHRDGELVDSWSGYNPKKIAEYA